MLFALLCVQSRVHLWDIVFVKTSCYTMSFTERFISIHLHNISILVAYLVDIILHTIANEAPSLNYLELAPATFITSGDREIHINYAILEKFTPHNFVGVYSND